MRILSLGAGVQSTAMLILALRNEIECDGVIFADTGSEKPTTYEILGELKKMMAEAKMPYQEVSQGQSLHEYCLERQIMPSIIRRWCTDRFKIRPIKRVLNDEDTVMIGFSLDEAQRIKRYRLPYSREFPLIELELTQADCLQIIAGYGLPQPTKSCCFYCPFQAPDSWRWLKNHATNLFNIALEIETKTQVERIYVYQYVWTSTGVPTGGGNCRSYPYRSVQLM